MGSKKIFVFVCVLLLALENVWSGGRELGIKNFMDAFSSQCSLGGQLSQQALATVDVLTTTIKSIEKDPKCSGLVGAVNELELISNSLPYLQQPQNSSSLRLLGLENRKREIFNLLSQNLSDAELSLLQIELRSVQMEIAEIRGAMSAIEDNERFERSVSVAKNLIQTTNMLTSRLASSEDCWVRYPSVLQQMAGVSLGVAQSLSVGSKNQDSALMMGAGLNLVSQVVDYFYRQSREKEIAPLLDLSESVALNCAIETMTNQYCQARDHEQSVRMVAKALTLPKTNDSVLSSLNLLEREVPNITEWLEMVMAGSAPSSSAAANRREIIYVQEEEIKSTLDFVLGLISEKQKFIDGITDSSQRWTELKNLVNEIILKTYGPLICYSSTCGTGGNPMTKRFDRNTAAYFLIGFSEVPKNPTQGSVIKFDEFMPYASHQALPNVQTIVGQATSQTVLLKFREWYSSSNELLIAEKSRVLIDDPLIVFAKFYPKSVVSSQKGISPRESMTRILDFLNSYKQTKFSNGNLKIIFTDTRKRLSDIIKISDQVMAQGREALSGLDEISKIAQLDKGVGFLKGRIDFFVRILIEDKLLSDPKLAKDQLQLLLASDVVSYLKQFSGTLSTQRILIDAQQAQGLSSATMLRFSEIFKDQLGQAVDNYDQVIKRLKEGPDGGNITSKTVLCLNLASLPEVSYEMNFKSCMGLQMVSVFPNGPVTPRINSQTMSLRFEDRVCQYRDFHRKNEMLRGFLEKNLSKKADQKRVY